MKAKALFAIGSVRTDEAESEARRADARRARVARTYGVSTHNFLRRHIRPRDVALPVVTRVTWGQHLSFGRVHRERPESSSLPPAMMFSSLVLAV